MADKKLEQEKLDLEWLMEHESGRRVVWRLLSYAGIYRDIEGEGSQAYKQIGRRQMGLHLLGLVSEASEDNVFKMMKEQREAALQEELENEETVLQTDAGRSYSDRGISDFI